MQDKEFDKLFSSKLDGWEVEPSAKIWQDISNELSGNKRKNSILYFSIAASVIVLIASGIVFMPNNRSVKSSVKNHLAANNVAIKKPVTGIKQPVFRKTNFIAANNMAHVNNTFRILKPRVVQNKVSINREPALLVTNNSNQVLVTTASAKTDIKQTIITDSSKSLASVKPVVQQPEKSATITRVDLPVERNAEIASIKKHKIHGIGDLLNVAIAAVDKRKDKIIEFSDTDDGSTITGVNLGIIKVKKEN